MRLVITSGHRVGSRWIHYLLAELLSQQVNPEMGEYWLENQERRDRVLKAFNSNKLLKFHAVTPTRLEKMFAPRQAKVLFVVRNPRDRVVSFAFHNRYHDRTVFPQKGLATDKEAVEYTLYEDTLFRREEEHQFKYMNPELSTRNYKGSDTDYIWTSYEWLKKDTVGEIEKILKYSKINLQSNKIIQAVNNNSFSRKANRPAGSEQRNDLWRRKGVIGDWRNWFTEKMIEDTQSDFDRYFEILKESDSNEN